MCMNNNNRLVSVKTTEIVRIVSLSLPFSIQKFLRYWKSAVRTLGLNERSNAFSIASGLLFMKFRNACMRNKKKLY